MVGFPLRRVIQECPRPPLRWVLLGLVLQGLVAAVLATSRRLTPHRWRLSVRRAGPQYDELGVGQCGGSIRRQWPLYQSGTCRPHNGRDDTDPWPPGDAWRSDQAGVADPALTAQGWIAYQKTLRSVYYLWNHPDGAQGGVGPTL